jgi:hypothetical protein
MIAGGGWASCLGMARWSWSATARSSRPARSAPHIPGGWGRGAGWNAPGSMPDEPSSSASSFCLPATHEDLIVNEGGAAATTRAILDVVSSVRSPRRLVS